MEYRTVRLGQLIQEKVGALIVEGKIKDPRVNTFLSITRVEVSKDLVWADVFVSTFKPESGLEKGVAGLQSAAGFIQAKIAETARLRQTPRLRFHEDAGIRGEFEMARTIEGLFASQQDTSG